MSFVMRSLAKSTRAVGAISKRNTLKCRVMSSKVYTEQQKAMGRPLSPHVTIYAFPVTAISSIMVRITGASLATGFAGIGALGFIGADIPALIDSAQSLPMVTPLSKFVVAFPITYHYMGGLRHIVWDHMPKLLETRQVAPSSMGMLGAATILSLGASFYTLKREKDE